MIFTVNQVVKTGRNKANQQETKAVVDLPNNDGETPLNLAAAKGEADIIDCKQL